MLLLNCAVLFFSPNHVRAVADALSLGMISIAAAQEISLGNSVKRESGVKATHVLKPPPVSML